MYTKMALKTISLFIAMLLAVSVLFTGCGGAPKEEGGSNAVTSIQQSTQQGSIAPATAKEDLPPVMLKWYFESPRPKDADEVYAKANEILRKEINTTVDFEPIDWGTFDQKIPLAIASGEEFDILFSAPWAAGSRYTTNATKGAIIPLDDLIDKYAPLTKKMIPQNIWDGCKVNGKIYGVPNYQIMATVGAIGINKSLADKYGFDPDTSVNTIFELEPVFEKIKNGEKNVAPLYNVSYTTDHSADKVIEYPVSEVAALGVRTDLKVFSILDDPEVQNAYKKTREWNVKGYLPKDVATAKDPSYQDAVKAGKVASVYTVYKPGGASDLKNSYGLDFYMVKVGSESLLSTSGITATMDCVSKTSKNPERAVMLFEQISQNKELYNTLVFGIEGKHYTRVSDNRIEIVKDPGYSAYSWMMGNQFLAYLTPGQDDDVWQQTMEINNNAKKTPTCGFTFDGEPVKAELAQLNAISAEFIRIQTTGILEYEKFFAEYKDKFEKAGLQKVKDELQKQIDAWKTTR